MEFLSKFLFGASICLILYVIYFEYRSAKINAENTRIKLGEKENEDLVNSLADDALVDLANKNLGLPGDIPPAPNSIDSKRRKS